MIAAARSSYLDLLCLGRCRRGEHAAAAAAAQPIEFPGVRGERWLAGDAHDALGLAKPVERAVRTLRARVADVRAIRARRACTMHGDTRRRRSDRVPCACVARQRLPRHRLDHRGPREPVWNRDRRRSAPSPSTRSRGSLPSSRSSSPGSSRPSAVVGEASSLAGLPAPGNTALSFSVVRIPNSRRSRASVVLRSCSSRTMSRPPAVRDPDIRAPRRNTVHERARSARRTPADRARPSWLCAPTSSFDVRARARSIASARRVSSAGASSSPSITRVLSSAMTSTTSARQAWSWGDRRPRERSTRSRMSSTSNTGSALSGLVIRSPGAHPARNRRPRTDVVEITNERIAE